MTDIECPLCKTVFEVDEYIDDSCPTCNNKYMWYEANFEEIEEFSSVVWEKYK